MVGSWGVVEIKKSHADRSGTSQTCTYRGNGRQGTAAVAAASAAGSIIAAWNSARLHLPLLQKVLVQKVGKKGGLELHPDMQRRWGGVPVSCRRARGV